LSRSNNQHVPEIITQFPVKVKYIVQKELPKNKRNEKRREEIFKILPRIIVELKYLEIQKKKKEVEYNDFDVCEKQFFFSCVSATLVGTK
jgi:hypothetical protein